jgi:predicted phosphoribosyltransferase
LFFDLAAGLAAGATVVAAVSLLRRAMPSRGGAS